MKTNEEIIDRYVDKKDCWKNYIEDAVLLTVFSVVLSVLALMNLNDLKPFMAIKFI